MRKANPPVSTILSLNGETKGVLTLVRGHWEHFAHDADVGIRGIGPTKADAFVQAAIALTAVITEPASILPIHSVPLDCRAPTDELLLLDWLNALIHEMAARRMLFREFAVELQPGRLHGWARGEMINPARYHPAVEVKGATLAELCVDCDNEGRWFAQCVVDVRSVSPWTSTA